MSKKKMTIENLAVLMQKGFEKTASKVELQSLTDLMHKSFEKTASKNELEELAMMVGKGFAGVDKRFEQMATKKDLLAVATKEDLRNTEDRLGRRIDGLELKISAYASSWTYDFKNLHEWVEDLAERLETVERKVKVRD